MVRTNGIRQAMTLDPIALKQLRNLLLGSAYVPGDDGYHAARLTWDAPALGQTPAIVVFPETAVDVVLATNFALLHGLPIGVRAGSYDRSLPVNEGLLLDFLCMKAMRLDTRKGTARVEPGVCWSDIVPVTQQAGLAPLNGFAPTVGVIEYLLGGGLGWLVRQYGLAASSIRSLNIVTGRGRFLQVDETSYPDLFWGLRGGGWNLGVVTSVEFALYPIKEVFGGQVLYPIEQGKEVIAAYLEWVKTVPETLTSSLRIIRFPPVPALPPELREKQLIIVLGCYNGPRVEGCVWFHPMRSLGTPVLDTFAQIPYSQIDWIVNDSVREVPTKLFATNKLLRQISLEDVDSLLSVVTDPRSGVLRIEIRQLGGILARTPTDAIAASVGDANFWLSVLMTAPTTEILKARKQLLTMIIDKLKSCASVRAVLNGKGCGGGSQRAQEAYPPENYQRLIALKKTYDPQNLLRFNNTILPHCPPGNRL